jgi:hypothetical protein
VGCGCSVTSDATIGSRFAACAFARMRNAFASLGWLIGRFATWRALSHSLHGMWLVASDAAMYLCEFIPRHYRQATG